MAVLSHRELRRAYLFYNRKYFGGRLPQTADVLFAPTDGCYAMLDEHPTDEITIPIDPKYAVDGKMWRLSLLHEMAHAASGDWKHGKRFAAEMDRVYAAGAFRRLL